MQQCEAAPQARIKNFPVSWFAVVMGLSGFTLAWRRAEQVFGLAWSPSSVLLWLTVAVALTLLGVYATKLWRYRSEVFAEFNHPVKQAFAPTLSIGMLLLAAVFQGVSEVASFWLWSVGAVLHLVLTLFVLSSWMQHSKYEIAHMNPAWFIPVVGNILVPIAGVHHAPADVSWFFFSLGLFFWPVLTAILMYRLIFHPSLPERLVPTLFIFIAPPAVGFVSWMHLVGHLDAFGMILYCVGLFFTLLLAVQIRSFWWLRFFLSWWAYSFPLAAITIASLIMTQQTQDSLYAWISTVLLTVLTGVILMLLIRTVQAVLRQEICVEGH
jgi:tellurite resistance protein